MPNNNSQNTSIVDKEVLWPKSSMTFLWFSRLVLSVLGLGTLLTIGAGDIKVEQGLDLQSLFKDAQFPQVVLSCGIFLLLLTPFVRNLGIFADLKTKKERARPVTLALFFSCLMVLTAWAFIYYKSR